MSTPTDPDPDAEPGSGAEPGTPREQVRAWLSEHRAAATVVAGLAAASLLLWVGLSVVTSGPSPDRAERSDGDEVAGGDDDLEADADADAGDDDVGTTGRPDDTEDEPDDTEDEPDDTEETDDADDTDEPDDADEPEDADDADDADAPGPSPEDHEPLDPSRADQRYIVVVASYASGPSAQRDAQAWAEREGHEPQLLWSSHYPALEPELWVVFEGPYPDRDAARDAADRLGGGAYLRDLADG